MYCAQIVSPEMAQTLFSASITPASTISLKSHRFLPLLKYRRPHNLHLACHNMPADAAIAQEWKTIQPLKIMQEEPKINPDCSKPDYPHSAKELEQPLLDEMDRRIEKLVTEIKGLFNSMEDGDISSSAYDTAWVARIPAIDGSAQPYFPQMVRWILQNQLADGSWGQKNRFLACDRLLNTLSCIITLALWGIGDNQVNRGVEFLKRNTETMIKEAVAHQSNGFEMIFPALLNEAKLLGLDLPFELHIIKQINKKRDSLLKRICIEDLHSHGPTLLQCLEGIEEVIDWKSILKLQSKDGSFSGSPACTAWVFMHTGDEKSLQFLTSLLKKFGDHVPCIYPVDIFERLVAVDRVESLGLERYFENEIKKVLDYVFEYWTERGVGFGRESLFPDIDVTATAFKLLRTFGYSVSSDVLKYIKGEAEELYKLSGSENSARIVGILNLYRCSQLKFPGEDVMVEIDAFAKDYLAGFLQSDKFSQAMAVRQNLPEEVKHSLSARWNRNLPRLMFRKQIEIFNPEDLLLGKILFQLPNASNKKYSDLAKLDFNRIQAIHRSEIQHVNRWYEYCNFPALGFARHRELAVYWTSSMAMFEPQYSDFRLDYTKAGLLATIIDDLYESYATMEQINLFIEAFERWDPSIIDELPEGIKIVFMGVYNTIVDISEKAGKVQGRDLFPHLHQTWLNMLISFRKEREWAEGNYSPSLDEYWQNAEVSMSLEMTILTTIFSMGEPVPDHILQKLDFLNLISLTARLVNDFRTFQSERERGEMASFVQCYMNENPGWTETEALNYMEVVNEDALTELNYNFLMRTEIPKHYRRLAFNTARIMQMIYSKEDGFRNAAEALEDSIKKSLFEPLL